MICIMQAGYWFFLLLRAFNIVCWIRRISNPTHIDCLGDWAGESVAAIFSCFPFRSFAKSPISIFSLELEKTDWEVVYLSKPSGSRLA